MEYSGPNIGEPWPWIVVLGLDLVPCGFVNITDFK